MKRKTIGFILGTIALILLAIALVIGLDDYQPFAQFSGKEVQCKATVDATFVGGKLDIITHKCEVIDTCIAVQPFSIFGDGECGILNPTECGDIEGDLQMLVGSSVKSSVEVDENRFGLTPGNYMLTACVTDKATQVKLRTINQQGGVDDEVTSTI